MYLAFSIVFTFHPN